MIVKELAALVLSAALAVTVWPESVNPTETAPEPLVDVTAAGPVVVATSPLAGVTEGETAPAPVASARAAEPARVGRWREEGEYRYDAAVERLLRAVAEARADGDAEAAQLNEALVRRLLGQRDRAAADDARREYAEQLGWLEGEAADRARRQFSKQLGWLEGEGAAEARDEYLTALDVYRAAAAESDRRHLDSMRDTITMLRAEIARLIEEGRHVEAERMLQDTDTLVEQLSIFDRARTAPPRGRSMSAGELAEAQALLELGRYREAENFLRQAERNPLARTDAAPPARPGGRGIAGGSALAPRPDAPGWRGRGGGVGRRGAGRAVAPGAGRGGGMGAPGSARGRAGVRPPGYASGGSGLLGAPGAPGAGTAPAAVPAPRRAASAYAPVPSGERGGRVEVLTEEVRALRRDVRELIELVHDLRARLEPPRDFVARRTRLNPALNV